MDAIDKKLLGLVQADNQRTHADLGEEIGLSPSAVRRRLNSLAEAGIIRKNIACLNPDDFGVTLIVTISFAEESAELYDVFTAQMMDLAPVQQCYHVAGDDDFVVIVHGPSLKWYEKWSQEIFMTNPAIRRYGTRVVWSRRKFAPAITFGLED